VKTLQERPPFWRVLQQSVGAFNDGAFHHDQVSYYFAGRPTIFAQFGFPLLRTHRICRAQELSFGARQIFGDGLERRHSLNPLGRKA
jgi:hypothetical protein